MSLPNIPFPFELSVDIPLLVHPAVVHFVVAIPVVILLLEIINLVFKKRAISVLSLFLILIVVASMGVAYFAGVVDGKEAYSLLVADGQAELKEHKLLGAYLVYASVALFILKILFMAFSQVVARLFFIVLLIGFISVTLKQGKDGGELVYEYGANSKAVALVEKKLEKLQDKYSKIEEEKKESEDSEETANKIKELQAKYDALVESSKDKSEVNETKVEVTEEEPTVETPTKVEVEKVESNETSSSTAVSLEIPSDSNESH
jgi:uncharacterized membrane protein